MSEGLVFWMVMAGSVGDQMPGRKVLWADVIANMVVRAAMLHVKTILTARSLSRRR